MQNRRSFITKSIKTLAGLGVLGLSAPRLLSQQISPALATKSKTIKYSYEFDQLRVEFSSFRKGDGYYWFKNSEEGNGFNGLFISFCPEKQKTFIGDLKDMDHNQAISVKNLKIIVDWGDNFPSQTFNHSSYKYKVNLEYELA